MSARCLPQDLTDPAVTAPAGLPMLAWEAALTAGELLLAGRGEVLTVATKTSATDVVTQMDTRSEAAIIDLILARRPADSVLGEEGGERSGSSGVRWVIDPLDGTVNYTYGQPLWAVSVAAEVAGHTVVGVVDVPVIGETYVAVRGHGSYLITATETTRLEVSTPNGLDAALVATGFGYAAFRRAAQGRTVSAVLPQVRDIRRGGAAAVELCFLAARRVDAYFERGVQPWDYAAGALIVSEAGAVVGGPVGQAPSSELFWATSPGLAAGFAELLDRSGAARD